MTNMLWQRHRVLLCTVSFVYCLALCITHVLNTTINNIELNWSWTEYSWHPEYHRWSRQRWGLSNVGSVVLTLVQRWLRELLSGKCISWMHYRFRCNSKQHKAYFLNPILLTDTLEPEMCKIVQQTVHKVVRACLPKYRIKVMDKITYHRTQCAVIIHSCPHFAAYTALTLVQL